MELLHLILRKKTVPMQSNPREESDGLKEIKQRPVYHEIQKKIVPMTEIGNTEPICPYCNFKFDKMPQKKKKCPNCNNFIISHNRPLDGKNVLLKEDQMGELGIQWSAKLAPTDFLSISEQVILEDAQSETLSLKNN